MKPTKSSFDQIKQLVSDPVNRIRLDDRISEAVRTFLAGCSGDQFPLHGKEFDDANVLARLDAYEGLTTDVASIMIALSRWGREDQVLHIRRILKFLADTNSRASGSQGWIALRWYPISFLFYAAGIAALSSDNYPALGALFSARTSSKDLEGSTDLVFVRANDGMADANAAFKLIPAYAQKKLPRSEAMFERVGPFLDRYVFLGASYEELFDRFEVINALAHSETRFSSGHAWGPPGRFAWKAAGSSGPLGVIRTEAEASGSNWPLLSTGLFQRSSDRFKAVVDGYVPLIRDLAW